MNEQSKIELLKVAQSIAAIEKNHSQICADLGIPSTSSQVSITLAIYQRLLSTVMSQ